MNSRDGTFGSMYHLGCFHFLARAACFVQLAGVFANFGALHYAKNIILAMSDILTSRADIVAEREKKNRDTSAIRLRYSELK